MVKAVTSRVQILAGGRADEIPKKSKHLSTPVLILSDQINLAIKNNGRCAEPESWINRFINTTTGASVNRGAYSN